MAGAGSPAACHVCAAPLPEQARFCPECGTPALGSAREIRKTVTLLFTDVAGSTTLGEELETEAYRHLMGRYFAVAREAVERHGGSVEKFVGDAVLAVFGVPEAHEDDALRAVRAAAELRAGLAAVSDDLTRTHGATLTIRAGVNTGPVVVGSARAGGSFATGDAVNTAARLEQAAGPGEILLGAETWQLVRDAVEVEAIEPISAKGKAEPVPAYRLLSVRSTDHGRARRLDDPLVGRERELAQLEQAFQQAVSGGPNEVVTVLGAAGMGKTRLIRDFCTRVADRAAVAEGRCLSYGQGITFYPLAGLIRSALHLTGTETPEVVRKALEDAVDDEPDVVGLLLPLLGAGGTAGSQEQTAWAVRRLVERLARREPLVLVIDDLHWAEPTLLQLLEQLHADLRDLPVLLVVGARPEMVDDPPQWPTRTLPLEQFSPDEVRARATTVLGGTLSDELADAVATGSGGNPLFVEELLTHLSEAGQVVRTDDAWEVVGEVVVPPSIASLLAVRLDRLPADERHVLERVAVIGLDFTHAEATLLTGADVDVAIASLDDRDLIQRVQARDEERWAFRHLTIRDAAYDALPKGLRADLHERFADALEADTLGDAGAERQAFVGHHLEQAVRLRREVAPRDPDHLPLAERAAATLHRAAKEALLRDDVPGAIALLNRAIDLPSPPTQRDLLVQLIESLYLHFRMTEVDDAVRRLTELTDETASALDHATVAMETPLAAMIGGQGIDPWDVVSAAERMRTLATETGDRMRFVRAVSGLSDAYGMLGRSDDQVRAVDEVLASGAATNVAYLNLVRASSAFIGHLPLSENGAFARAGWRGPIVTESERLFFELYDAMTLTVTDPSAARAVADRVADRVEAVAGSASYLGAYCADVYYLIGELDLAEHWYGQVARAMGEHGDLSHGSSYIANQAFARIDRGDPLERVIELRELVDEWVSEGDVGACAQAAVLGSIVAARTGDLNDARTQAELAITMLEPTQLQLDRAEAYRHVSEWARLAGDHDEERRLLMAARDVYDAKEIVFWAGVCRWRLAELDQ